MSDFLTNDKSVLRISQNGALTNVGYLEIAPGIRLYIRKRPNRFHRWMVFVLLGWKWTDEGWPLPTPHLMKED